jgi:MATE family multidrug resistance protein
MWYAADAMADLLVPVGKNVVTHGSPYAVVMRLAWPTFFAMLLQSAVNEIDIVFFAKLPPTEASNAQAALLPSLIILWLFGGSLSGIAVGTQAITARRFAEQRNEDAGAVLFNAAFFAFVGGLVFATVGYIAMDLILGLLIKVDGARESAQQYLKYRLLGVISMAVTAAFKAFFDGIGRTHIHLISSVVMNVLNVGLCVLLIFGTWGFPRMGIGGAGLAAVISTFVGLGIMIFYALRADNAARFKPFRVSNLSKTLLWSVLKLSIPGAIATIAVMLGFGMFAWVASKLDELSPSASGIPVNMASTTVIVGILKLTFTGCLAFGTATATLVSQSLGEKAPERATMFGWTSVKLGLIIFGVVGISEAIFAEPILHFVAAGDAVQLAALTPLRIMGAVTPIIAVAMILTQALFGAGDTVFVMIVELVLHFLCLVPLAMALAVWLNFGLIGLWAAAVIYIIALTIAMSLKFHWGSWKKITL